MDLVEFIPEINFKVRLGLIIKVFSCNLLILFKILVHIGHIPTWYFQQKSDVELCRHLSVSCTYSISESVTM